MTDIDVNALLAKIARLEKEKAAATKATTITLGEYRGHPVVKFEGNFRPFNLGFSKIRAVLSVADELKAMMEEHAKKKK